MAVLLIVLIWFAIPIIWMLIYSIRDPPFFTVQEQQAVIIERFGRFHEVAGPGFHFMLPGIDRRRKFKDGDSLLDYVDLRERSIKVSPQNVITKDNIHLHVEGIAYYEITDPLKVVYAVADVIFAINKVLEMVLCDVIGEIEFQELFKRRDEMSITLRDQIAQVSDDWGITIRTVELETVTSLGVIDPERPLQQGEIQHKHAYFLSHSSENHSEADHVEVMLWRNKRFVLRDESKSKTDVEISETGKNMIQTANTFIALWNEQYVKNDRCLKELEYGHSQQTETQNLPRIVLIMLNETEVPDKFSDVLRLSGQDRGQREQAIQRLLKEEAV